jgi:hypothetical protein
VTPAVAFEDCGELPTKKIWRRNNLAPVVFLWFSALILAPQPERAAAPRRPSLRGAFFFL